MKRKLKFIKHCNLTNTVVNVCFSTPFDVSYIIQMIIKAYEDSNVKISEYPLTNTGQPENVINKVTCLANNTYKVIIEKGRLSFNIIQEYISWADYKDFITIAIEALPKQDLIFQSAGVNYISAFPNIRLFNALKGSVHLECYENVFGAELRYPLVVDGCRGFVRITNLLPQDNVHVSFLDITIFQDVSVNSTDELWNILDKVHDKEKDELLKIIKEDFLRELGAVYENE